MDVADEAESSVMDQNNSNAANKPSPLVTGGPCMTTEEKTPPKHTADTATPPRGGARLDGPSALPDVAESPGLSLGRKMLPLYRSPMKFAGPKDGATRSPTVKLSKGPFSANLRDLQDKKLEIVTTEEQVTSTTDIGSPDININKTIEIDLTEEDGSEPEDIPTHDKEAKAFSFAPPTNSDVTDSSTKGAAFKLRTKPHFTFSPPVQVSNVSRSDRASQEMSPQKSSEKKITKNVRESRSRKTTESDGFSLSVLPPEEFTPRRSQRIYDSLAAPSSAVAVVTPTVSPYRRSRAVYNSLVSEDEIKLEIPKIPRSMLRATRSLKSPPSAGKLGKFGSAKRGSKGKEKARESLDRSHERRSSKGKTSLENSKELEKGAAIVRRQRQSSIRETRSSVSEPSEESQTDNVQIGRKGREKRTSMSEHLPGESSVLKSPGRRKKDQAADEGRVTPGRRAKAGTAESVTKTEEVKDKDAVERDITPGRSPGRRGKGKKAETNNESVMTSDVVTDKAAEERDITPGRSPGRKSRAKKTETDESTTETEDIKDKAAEERDITPGRSPGRKSRAKKTETDESTTETEDIKDKAAEERAVTLGRSPGRRGRGKKAGDDIAMATAEVKEPSSDEGAITPGRSPGRKGRGKKSQIEEETTDATKPIYVRVGTRSSSRSVSPHQKVTSTRSPTRTKGQGHRADMSPSMVTRSSFDMVSPSKVPSELTEVEDNTIDSNRVSRSERRSKVNTRSSSSSLSPVPDRSVFEKSRRSPGRPKKTTSDETRQLRSPGRSKKVTDEEVEMSRRETRAGSRSKSPEKSRTKSAVKESPEKSLLKSPQNSRSRSPVKSRSKSPNKSRSKSPTKLPSKSPIKSMSKSPVKPRSKSPVKSGDSSGVDSHTEVTKSPGRRGRRGQNVEVLDTTGTRSESPVKGDTTQVRPSSTLAVLVSKGDLRVSWFV